MTRAMSLRRDERREQVLDGDRLLNDAKRSLQGRVVVLNVFGGHHDDRHARVLRVNPAQELAAVHDGHLNVRHDGERLHSRQRLQRRGAVRNGDDRVPFLREEVGDHLYPLPVVVDDKDHSVAIGHLPTLSKNGALHGTAGSRQSRRSVAAKDTIFVTWGWQSQFR